MGWKTKSLICGYGGFNKNPNYKAIPITDLRTAINVDRSRRTWRKMEGANLHNTNIIDSGARIQAGYVFPKHTVITETEVTKNTAESADDAIETDNGVGTKTVDIDTNNIRYKYVSDTSPVDNTGWVDFQTFTAVEVDASLPAWTNVSKAASSNNQYTQALFGESEASNRLTCTNPDVSFPTDALITGIQIRIERKASNDGIGDYMLDRQVTLTPASSDNKAKTSDKWPTSDAYATYGSTSTKWGLSAAERAGTAIDDSDWGVKIRVDGTLTAFGTGRAYIDHVQVKFTYTFPDLRYSSAVRFDNVTVPASASIVSAKIKLVANGFHSEVVVHNAVNYICKADHTSGAANEPGVGGSWATYWRVMADEDSSEAETTTPASWVTATGYTGDYATDVSTLCEVIGINEADANCDIFVDGTGDPVTDRTQTIETHLWSLLHLGDTMQYSSPDIFDTVQELIDNGNWASGQAMGFILKWVTSEPEIFKKFYAYDEGTADYYPELYIKYQTEADSGETTLVCTGTKKLIGIDAADAHTTLKTYTNYPTNDDAIAPVIIEGTLAVGGKGLFVFQGVDEVQQWDGAAGTTSNITNPNADWGAGAVKYPTAGILHNSRMWAFGTVNKEHDVYYSAFDDNEDYLAASGGGIVRVDPGFAEKVIGAVVFMGRLYFFKYPNGIYVLDDTSVDRSTWHVLKISDDVGLAGPRAIAPIGNADCIIFGSDGMFYSLKAAWQTGDVKHAKILADQFEQWSKDNITLSDNLNRATLVYQSTTGMLYALFALKTAADSQLAIGIDFREYNRAALLEYNRDEGEALFIDKNDPHVGGTDGWIYHLGDGTYNKNGAGYSCEFITPPVELENGINVANLHEITFILDGAGTHDFDVEIFGDGVKIGNTLQISKSTAKDITYVRERLEGECSNITVRVTNNTIDTQFSITDIIIHYSKGARKIN